MAIAVKCDACGAAFKVADTFAGKRGKCPKCGHVFQAAGASPAQQQSPPGTARGANPSSSNPAIRPKQEQPASAKPVRATQGRAGGSPPKPPAAPVRAVPVGSLPNEIPVGSLPGEGPAVVRPAGVQVAQGVRPAGVPVVKESKVAAEIAYRKRRKKGTPVILWVICAVGGLSAAGGWIYYAMRNTTDPAAIAGKNKETDSAQPSTEKSAAGNAKEEDKKQADESSDKNASASEEGKADSATDGVNEKAAAEQGGAEEGDENLALALGGGDIPKSSPRKPGVVVRTTPSPTSTEKVNAEQEAAEVAPAEPATAEQMTALAEVCKANAWKADSAEQYEALSALATAMMNYADDAAHEVALGLLNGPLAEIIWTTEKARRMNRYATKDLDKPGKSFFLLAEVSEQVDGGAILKLLSTEALVKMELSGTQLALTRPGKNYLLIGTVEPETVDLPPAADSDRPRTARVINALFRVGISEVYDRENSTIGPAGVP